MHWWHWWHLLNYFIQMVLKNIREKAIHMKNSLHVQICCPNSKMQKYLKNNFGNIFKIFFKNCWNIFRKSANYGRKTPIFEKYFKNVPKIFFLFFFHFWTRTSILYMLSIFHTYIFFSSFHFSHLKIESILENHQ